MNWRTTTSTSGIRMGIIYPLFTLHLIIIVIVTTTSTASAAANNFNTLNSNYYHYYDHYDNVVTGKPLTQLKELPPRDSGLEGSNDARNHFRTLKSPLNPEINDSEDVQLPSFTFQDDDNGIKSRTHILSKRQVNNDYERFYLCLFTLFTNPNCQRQQQQQQDYQFQNNYNQQQNGFLPLFPQQGMGSRPGGGIFGLGLGLGNELFGRPFNQNRNQNQQNNYYPQQNLFQPQPVVVTPVVASGHQPFFEQQNHRRPGPAVTAPTSTLKPTTTTQKATTTTKTPQTPSTTTTTTKPTTTTRVPTTTRATTTTRRPIGFGNVPSASISSNKFIPPAIKIQNNVPLVQVPLPDIKNKRPPLTFVPSKLLNVECDNKTTTSRPTTTTSTSTTTVRPWSTSSSTVIKHIPKPKPPVVPVAIEHIFDNSLTLKISQLEEENKSLKSQADQVTSFQIQVKYLQEALTIVQSERDKSKSRVSQLERTNEHLQKHNGQLQHSVGDQRTRINELNSKVKYLEDKLLKMSRQSLPLTREIERHREAEIGLKNSIRELTQQVNECKQQVYQFQTRDTHRIGVAIGEEQSQDVTFKPLEILATSSEEHGNQAISFETFETTLKPDSETTLGSENDYNAYADVETTVLPLQDSQYDDVTTVDPAVVVSDDVVTVSTSDAGHNNTDTLPSPSPTPLTTTTAPSITTTSTTVLPVPIHDPIQDDEDVHKIQSEFPPEGPFSDIIFDVDDDDDDENDDGVLGDEFAIDDDVFHHGGNLGSSNVVFAPGSFVGGGVHDNLNQEGYTNTYNHPFNNAWTLPLSSSLFNNQRHNVHQNENFDNSQNNGGYGHDQVYFRNL